MLKIDWMPKGTKKAINFNGRSILTQVLIKDTKRFNTIAPINENKSNCTTIIKPRIKTKRSQRLYSSMNTDNVIVKYKKGKNNKVCCYTKNYPLTTQDSQS